MAKQIATDHAAGTVTETVLPEWDDATRTVTTYDAADTVTGTRPYTPDENAAADAALAAAARLDDLSARVARIEAHLWPAPDDLTTPDDPTVADWAELGGIWPDQGLLREGSTIWRNVSGVPLTTPPSGFPGAPARWGHLFAIALAPEPEPPAPTVPAWSATASYKVGDKCSRGGRIYQCKVAHGPEYAGTWGPPQGSVWTDIGPA